MSEILIELEFDEIEACLADLELDVDKTYESIEMEMEQVEVIYIDREQYKGPLEIIPKVDEDQSFETAEKYMPGDLLVREVQVRVATGPTGGLTYYIE